MWTKKDIPELIGKTAIVTGANTGLGYETALALYEAGAYVILACRSLEKAEDTKFRLNKLRGKGSLEIGVLDLSDFTSVRQFAKTFIEGHNQLHLLINNAGVAVPPETKTKQGYELQFGVNFLGHFALTGYLYPLLKTSQGSRVVTLSSMGYQRGNIDFDNLKSEKNYDRLREYSQSKLADLLFALELHRRIKTKGDQVLSIAAQPGANNTELTRYSSDEELAAGKERIGVFMEPSQGALSTLYAAVSSEARGGEMYEPDQGYRGYPVLATINENAMDEALANKLWKLAEEITSLQYP